ncbi:hypothetical protein GCM10027047_11650 [Rhodococcus aerolatus]
MLLDRFRRPASPPPGWPGRLDPDEDVLAVAPLRAGHLVATRLGLWVPGPDPTADPAVERVAWHLVSAATWSGTELDLRVAEETGTAGAAVLLADTLRRVYTPTEPGRLPAVVQARVTATIRSTHHQQLPGGGAWFVQRRVPGHDGVVLQVRVDPGTDPAVVHDVAETVAGRLPRRA